MAKKVVSSGYDQIRNVCCENCEHKELTAFPAIIYCKVIKMHSQLRESTKCIYYKKEEK